MPRRGHGVAAEQLVLAEDTRVARTASVPETLASTRRPSCSPDNSTRSGPAAKTEGHGSSIDSAAALAAAGRLGVDLTTVTRAWREVSAACWPPTARAAPSSRRARRSRARALTSA